LLDAIERSLSFETTRETRNLKRLRPDPLCRFELRVGSFRVLFDVIEAATEVLVLAVGKKDGNRLYIAGREISL
jgi:mRNA-degrading endonuclease RelE of RelBE toxin-antitoxin system